MTTATIATTPKTQIQPPFGPSVDSLCQPSPIGLPFLKLPPPPCAVLLVHIYLVYAHTQSPTQHQIFFREAQLSCATLWCSCQRGGGLVEGKNLLQSFPSPWNIPKMQPWFRNFRYVLSWCVYSPPVRWGLLDFMSAGRLPPSSFFLLLPPSSSFLLLPPSSSFLLLPPSSFSFFLLLPPPSSSFLPGPQLQALDHSRSQCSPPDPIKVFPAGPPPQAPDQSVPRRTSTANSGSECSPPDLNHKEPPNI